MISCTRRIEFDAAHRVMEHESKCRFVHGHRYAVEVTFSAPALDTLGRVVDFGVIKERLGAWIDLHWDHTAILHEADKTLGLQLETATGQKNYYLPYNPTAENLAHYLLTKVCPQLFGAEGAAQVISVLVYETPNCSAVAHR